MGDTGHTHGVTMQHNRHGTTHSIAHCCVGGCGGTYFQHMTCVSVVSVVLTAQSLPRIIQDIGVALIG